MTLTQTNTYTLTGKESKDTQDVNPYKTGNRIQSAHLTMHKPTHKESNSGFNGLGQKKVEGREKEQEQERERVDEMKLSSEANYASLNEIN